MLRLRNTIVTKFTVTILLILVVGQGILYTWLLLYQKSYLEKRLRDEVIATGRNISGLIITMVHEPQKLDMLLETLVRSGIILSIKVTDSESKTIGVKTRQVKESGGGLNPFFIFYIPEKNTINISLESDTKEAGNIEIIYSGQTVNEVMKRFLLIPPVMQSVTFLFIVFAIVRFFQSKVGRPVAVINKTLARVTTGDLAVEVPEMDNSEMGSIADGLRFLIERLASTIARFNSMSSNVAIAMEQITLTLKNVNEAAKKQAKSIDGVIYAIRAANDSQREITKNTGRLSGASSENVSSLLEIKATAEEIASSTDRLLKSTEDSYAMIAEMSQTAKAIAESANEVSHAVRNTSASVEKISVSLNTVMDNTKKSAELASLVRKFLTDRGTLALADAMDATEKVVNEVNHSAEIIRRLDEKSKDIEKVLHVIKDVTEKTNLLSLNAAILAVQAGEYGAGFSVVADEMGALSDRTSSSARDIAGIVMTIQSEIHEAVNAIKSGVGKVKVGQDLIFRAGEAMGETLEAAQRSAQMAEEIERATKEQSEGLKQINLLMENIRLMIEDVVKATEEQMKGSAHMLESISDVKEVAEIVRRGTGEHAQATEFISKNLELTSDMVSQIDRAALDQLKTNEGFISVIEQVNNAGVSVAKDMEEVMLSFNTLRDEVDFLKKQMGVFKTRK